MKLSFARSICLCSLMVVAALQGAWTPLQNLSPSEQCISPLFAADLNGNVLAVWSSGDLDSGYMIQSSTKLFGEDWQATPDTIYTSPYLPSLQLALDDAGNATVVWEEFDGTEHQIRALTKGFENPWQATPDTIVTIPQSERFSSVCVRLVVDSAGNATVVWQTLSDPMLIQSSSKPLGQPWQQTPDSIAQGSYIPCIELVVDGAGDITAAWIESSDLISIIYTSTKVFGDPWPTTPDIVGSGSCVSFQLSTNINGDAALVWIDEISKVNVSTRSGEESWSAPSIIGRNADAWGIPQIIVDKAGNATAAWVGSDGIKPCLQSSTKLAGHEWPRIPDTLIQGPKIAFFQLAADDSGNITALWASGYETQLLIQSSTKLFGQGWAITPDILCQTTDVAQMKLAVDGQGNAIALWMSFDQERSIFVTQGSIKLFGHNWTEASTMSQNVDIMAGLQLILDVDGNATTGWAVRADVEGANTDDDPRIVLKSLTHIKESFSPPTVTHLAPSAGGSGGGNTVIITGTNFIDVSSVQFGPYAARFTVTSPTSIVVIAPRVSSNTSVHVTVTTPFGTSPNTDVSQYTYQHSSSDSQRPPTTSQLLPCAPSKCVGVLKKRKHGSKRRYQLRIKWNPSCSRDIAYYRIYKGSKVIATISPNSKLFFKTRLESNRSVKKFTIASVTSDARVSKQKRLKAIRYTS